MKIPDGIKFDIEIYESRAISILMDSDLSMREIKCLKVRASLRGGKPVYEDYADLRPPYLYAAYLLAVCKSLRNSTRLEAWDLYGAGNAVAWLDFAMQYPDIAAHIITSKQSVAGKGNSHPDRDLFKADYRAERGKFKSRDSCIKSLMKDYPEPSFESMRKWAKQAESEK